MRDVGFGCDPLYERASPVSGLISLCLSLEVLLTLGDHTLQTGLDRIPLLLCSQLLHSFCQHDVSHQTRPLCEGPSVLRTAVLHTVAVSTGNITGSFSRSRQITQHFSRVHLAVRVNCSFTFSHKKAANLPEQLNSCFLSTDLHRVGFIKTGRLKTECN